MSMSETTVPGWLQWAREIQSMCQTGLAYSSSDYETQRYKRLMEIAAEIVKAHTGLPLESLVKNFCAQPGYATVKVDVRGAVIRDEKILLVQERKDHRWAMPGGWADVGEIPSEMVAREVWEESGFVVVPKKVVGIYDANRAPVHLEFFHAYKIVFLCDITGGDARTSDETMDVGFFSFDDLPPLSMYRTNERHLKDVYAHFKDPSRSAFFD
jgi:ADP-ribose pyrophosphatase YjhB (NUDIX family)